jgi:hypothetical protein
MERSRSSHRHVTTGYAGLYAAHARRHSTRPVRPPQPPLDGSIP